MRYCNSLLKLTFPNKKININFNDVFISIYIEYVIIIGQHWRCMSVYIHLDILSLQLDYLSVIEKRRMLLFTLCLAMSLEINMKYTRTDIETRHVENKTLYYIGAGRRKVLATSSLFIPPLTFKKTASL